MAESLAKLILKIQDVELGFRMSTNYEKINSENGIIAVPNYRFTHPFYEDWRTEVRQLLRLASIEIKNNCINRSYTNVLQEYKNAVESELETSLKEYLSMRLIPKIKLENKILSNGMVLVETEADPLIERKKLAIPYIKRLARDIIQLIENSQNSGILIESKFNDTETKYQLRKILSNYVKASELEKLNLFIKSIPVYKWAKGTKKEFYFISEIPHSTVKYLAKGRINLDLTRDEAIKLIKNLEKDKILMSVHNYKDKLYLNIFNYWDDESRSYLGFDKDVRNLRIKN